MQVVHAGKTGKLTEKLEALQKTAKIMRLLFVLEL